ncbi:MAG TPA: 2-oxoacid:ferredoxin oxidoreductase subunit beta [Bacteroidota bacterium]|jgi:2-oxoglutarate ferredoxin oxidoreductase subunit beta|nr:2-oxoacid:ferredoxin oxidoreductase subunit beta [Bacteroidota bacterium]
MPETLEKQPTVSVKLTIKDFQSDQDVRWCPGCGDYSILAQVQRVLPEFTHKKENYVMISGIGCSSRFPYYMDTFGIHGIHGRAPAIASGVKIANPDLQVWVATGDGDGLSIGGNHMIHMLRRNLNIKVLMFNNQIYGLTKGQFSPTSLLGQVTKSTPYGVIDNPFIPVSLALGSGATLVARTMDRDPKHLQEMVRRAEHHKGTAFVEIYQNCNVFNDGAFFAFTEKDARDDTVVYLEHRKPLVFGKQKEKGIRLNGFTPEVVNTTEGKHSVSDLLVHNENDSTLAFILANMIHNPELPRAMGVFLATDRVVYEEQTQNQIARAKAKKGEGDLQKLLDGDETWVIQ